VSRIAARSEGARAPAAVYPRNTPANIFLPLDSREKLDFVAGDVDRRQAR